MRVLVCGGRHYYDYAKIAAALDALHAETPIDAIVHGGCSGADELAGRWARRQHIEEIEFKITKTEWKRLGFAAGPIRNSKMLKEGKPDVVLSFPGNDGTADMLRKAHKANVAVREVK